MGILIMRLNEHRMTTSTEMNTSLKHVTVLEEAHNILKKTSTEQDSEGSNVTGKSVEMISNAIAEMRTYGEGFIIVDQSPSAVDVSAIRNTNTKIIMRLPDENDRRMSGKSAGLKDEQLDEIAKLPKGVAVVYQNNWVEPVLCKIQKYRGTEGIYKYDNSSVQSRNTYAITEESKVDILKALLDKATGEKLDMNISDLFNIILGSSLRTGVKKEVLTLISSRISNSLDSVSKAVCDIVCEDEMLNELAKATSIEDWENKVIENSNIYLEMLPDWYQDRIVECIVREQAKLTDDPEKYVNIWAEYKKGDIY